MIPNCAIVQRSNDCHNEVITSSLQGSIERPLEDYTCNPLLIGFMIPDYLPALQSLLQRIKSMRLRLPDITVEDAERKRPYSDSTPGVIICANEEQTRENACDDRKASPKRFKTVL